MTGSYWAVAQTVSKMEHVVRREIEKTNRGAFLPTYSRTWKVDDIDYAKEYPLVGGYVFFMTKADDWAGIPDIHGVYNVLSNPDGSAKRVDDESMKRLVIGHITGEHNTVLPPRFTKYYRPQPTRRRNSRKPRSSRKLRNATAA